MLLDPRFSGKSRRFDVGGVMIAIPAQIVDSDCCIRNRLCNKRVNRPGIHCHAYTIAKFAPFWKGEADKNMFFFCTDVNNRNLL